MESACRCLFGRNFDHLSLEMLGKGLEKELLVAAHLVREIKHPDRGEANAVGQVPVDDIVVIELGKRNGGVYFEICPESILHCGQTQKRAQLRNFVQTLCHELSFFGRQFVHGVLRACVSSVGCLKRAQQLFNQISERQQPVKPIGCVFSQQH